MNRTEFLNAFYGPANKRNREAVAKKLGVTSFAGIPLKRLGWAGWKNAIGYHFGLDTRNFSCEARFEDALAEKLSHLDSRQD